jgi:LuxR family maltose regulon positive regulatory protein
VLWIAIDHDFKSLNEFCGFLTDKLNRAASFNATDATTADDDLAAKAIEPAKSSMAIGTMGPRQSQTKYPTNAILSICNGIVPMGHDLILVLDGIEQISATDSLEYLEQTIVNAPSHVHFILVSQSVPDFRLTLRRARGQCGIVAADDLLFTGREINGFMRAYVDRSLTNRELKRIERLTEGRLLDLKIVALALQEDASGTSKVLDSIEGGGNATIERFIIEAVSEMDTADAAFLLRVSILESCTPMTSDFVYQTAESACRLQALAASCFLTTTEEPISGNTVYSYRPLYLKALQRSALANREFDIGELAERINEWHIAHNEYEHVIKHCVRFKQWGLLSEAMEDYSSELIQSAISARFRGIDLDFESIEDDVLEKNPFLLVLLAHVALNKDNPNDAERWLLAASELIKSAQSDNSVSFTRFGLWIEILLTLSKGQNASVREGVEIGNLVIEKIGREDRFLYSWALGALGSLYQRGEDLEKSIEVYQESLSVAAEVDNSFIYLVSSYFLSRQYVSSGKLKRAEKVLTRARQEIEAKNMFAVPFASLPDIGLANIRLAQYRLEDADRLIYQGMKRIRTGTSTEFFADAQLALARIKQLRGDYEDAQLLLEETIRYAMRHNSNHSLNLARLSLARIHAINGEVDAAKLWLREAEPFSSGEDYHIFKAFQFALARILISESMMEDAIELLKHLITRSSANQRLYDAIDAQILLAIAYSKDDKENASRSLRKAILLAAPEGIQEPFVMERALLQPLFISPILDASPDTLLHKGTLSDFIASIQLSSDMAAPQPAAKTAVRSNLNVALTRREREICHLLLSGTSHNEIARRLFISCNTVHTHCNNIYSKLGVHNRQELINHFSHEK